MIFVSFSYLIMVYPPGPRMQSSQMKVWVGKIVGPFQMVAGIPGVGGPGTQCINGWILGQKSILYTLEDKHGFHNHGGLEDDHFPFEVLDL